MEVVQGRYEIERELGRGSQATTFLAHDTQTGSKVALKMFDLGKASDWKAFELFEREANVLRSLKHPNIPSYIDTFTQEKDGELTMYIIQEYIEGEPLDARLTRSGVWSEEDAKEALKTLLETLMGLHNRVPSLVHRDIKPSNVLISKKGLHLIDFGAVQNTLQGTVGGSTVIGTPGYMAMEQMIGRAEPRSDVYSLGVMFCYLCTGVPPTDIELKNGKLGYEALLEKESVLTSVLLRMIEPAVEHRFDSAHDALMALTSSHDSKVTVLPDPEPSTPYEDLPGAQEAGFALWDTIAAERLGDTPDQLSFFFGPYEEVALLSDATSIEVMGWTPVGTLRTNAMPLSELSRYYRSPDGASLLEVSEGTNAEDDIIRVITFFEDGTSVATGSRLNGGFPGHDTHDLDVSNSAGVVAREHERILAPYLERGARPLRDVGVQRAYLWTRSFHDTAMLGQPFTELMTQRIMLSILFMFILILPLIWMYFRYLEGKLSSSTHVKSLAAWKPSHHALPSPRNAQTPRTHTEQNEKSGVMFDFDEGEKEVEKVEELTYEVK